MKIITKSSLMLAALLTIGLKLGAMAGSPLPLKKQLFNAIEQNDIAEVKKLLEQNVDVNETNKRGETPLHVAAKATENQDKAAEIATVLIAAGADINTGRVTPLQYAVRSNNIPVVKVLLEKGVDLSDIDQESLDALRGQRGEIVDLIEKAKKIHPTTGPQQSSAAQQPAQGLTDEQILTKGTITTNDVKKVFPDMTADKINKFVSYANGLEGAISSIKNDPALEEFLRPGAKIFEDELDKITADWRKIYQ